MESRKTLSEDASVEAVKVYANATVYGIPAIKHGISSAFFDGWHVGFNERGVIAEFADKSSEHFQVAAFVLGWCCGALLMVVLLVK